MHYKGGEHSCLVVPELRTFAPPGGQFFFFFFSLVRQKRGTCTSGRAGRRGERFRVRLFFLQVLQRSCGLGENDKRDNRTAPFHAHGLVRDQACVRIAIGGPAWLVGPAVTLCGDLAERATVRSPGGGSTSANISANRVLVYKIRSLNNSVTWAIKQSAKWLIGQIIGRNCTMGQAILSHSPWPRIGQKKLDELHLVSRIEGTTLLE